MMMKKLRFTAFGAALILLLFSGLVNAQISVNRSVIEFSNTDRIQDIEVLNTGEHNVYLDLQAAEIINPQDEDAERVELNDPRTSPLIVSPRQLLVPPGERRRMRVILRQQAEEHDRVFRLSVKPYTGKLNVNGDDTNKKSSAIKVLVGYDLLLLSRPDKLDTTVKVTRDHHSIAFHNQGNTNVLLRKIEQCNSEGAECIEIQPNRLYAGEVYKIDLPKAGPAKLYPVKVWQSVGLDNQKVSY